MNGQQTPPGWYVAPMGEVRWWDGYQWTEHVQPSPMPAVQHAAGPMTAAGLNVQRDVSYVRQQTGHSLTLWILGSAFLLVPVVGLIYFTVSPNHYWHA